MPRDLTQTQVNALKDKGTYRVAKMLYIRIFSPTCRIWVFRYSLHGRRHWHGLGPVDQRPYRKAREKALELQLMLAQGGDPLAHKAAAQARVIEARETESFEACCVRYLADNSAGFRSKRTANEFLNIFRMHCGLINKMPVSSITSPNVAAVLRPLQLTKPPTAQKLKNRIQRVLSWAKVQGLRNGDNPAANEALRHLLPSQKGVIKGHRKGLAWQDLPQFVADLTTFGAMEARALLFTVLTAGRTGETLGAAWGEIDFHSGIWTIPAKRMKSSEEHRVILTPRILELLHGLPPGQGKDYVFRRSDGSRLPEGALRHFRYGKMPLAETTIHGFRNTFSTWCADTEKGWAARERALSHKVGNAVERAYQKSDLLELRKPLMLAWEAHCFSGIEGSDAAHLGGEGLVSRQVTPRKISLAT